MDDRIRSIAHEARTEVEHGLDLDHELAETLGRNRVGTASLLTLDGPRRRGALWAAAAAVTITVGVGGLWLARDNNDDTVLTADPPSTQPVTATTTVEPEAPTTDPPATTVASSASTTTVAPPSTTIDVPSSPVLPVPGTIELDPSDLIARETDGDVWWYPAALTDQPGEPVLLIDRADPRVVPSEGEGPNVIDEVAGTFDGSLIYSDCCEPVSGNVFAIGEPGAEIDRSSPTGRSDRFQLFGVGANPHLEPDGTRVLMHNSDYVNVVDMGTGDQQFVSTMGAFADRESNVPGPPFRVDDAAWTSSGTIALLGRSDTNGVILTEHDADDVRVELHRTELDFVVDPQTQDLGQVQIVGTIDGSILVAAYSPEGFQLVAVDLTDWTAGNAALPFAVPAASDFVRLTADGTTAAWIVDGASFLQRSGEAPIEWRDDIAEIWFPSIETSTRPSTPPVNPPPVDPPGVEPKHAGEFVTVTGDSSTIIDVRDADGVVSSHDLGCPLERVCVVESARVMGDTIWTTIIERQSDEDDTVTGTRVMSVSLETDNITEHLAIDGPTIAHSAGLGADGIVYAQLDEALGYGSSFVAIENGVTRELETGVSSFLLSNDGRLLAVSFAIPSAGSPARLAFADLVDGRTNEVQTNYVNAGPAAWSPAGRHLVLAENWEDGEAWVIDPWSDSVEPLPGTERFLDGACFVNDNVIAYRTWDVGYGQGDAQLGAIRLTSIDTGDTVADLGTDLFGENRLACHPDGSVNFVRRPVTEVEIAPDFTQLEPVYDDPVELAHVDPTGTITVQATGDLRLF